VIYIIGHSRGRGFVASWRIASLLGIDREVLLRDIVWVDLFDHAGVPPSRYVDLVDRAATPNDAIILLSRDVAKQYGMDLLGPLAVARRHGGMGATVMTLPDPSKLNPWWNRRDHVTMASEMLRKVWSEHL
jgi:hypothetical protein